MPRPLTEIERRWVASGIRNTRRSARIGWALARWVFLGGALVFAVLAVAASLDGGSWPTALGAGALGLFMGLASRGLPVAGEGRADALAEDALQAQWIRGNTELVHVGSGKSASVIKTFAGARVVAPSGWLDDLLEGEEAEVEAVVASTPGVHAGIPGSLWIVAIRGKRSLRAELEAGCTGDPALDASLWWWGGGLVLGAGLIALLVTGGFPPKELRELPAVWSPRARIPATEGWVVPVPEPRPGDGFVLGAHFARENRIGPEEGVPLVSWTPPQRDSFLQTIHDIRERMTRASSAADSARSVLWAFRPAFHNIDLQGFADEYDARSARAFRREWPTRKAERKDWLARMDTLLPGDTSWMAFLLEVRRNFASVDSSGGDTATGRMAAEALHRKVLRLLHPDSSRLLQRVENEILRGMWTRAFEHVLDASLAPGVLLVTDSAPYPIPEEFDPGERWLLRPVAFDGSMLDSLPSAFRPAGAHAVLSHIRERWAVVRLGEPPTLRDLLESLQYWIAFLGALAIWLIVGIWKINVWLRESAIARAASTAWWSQNPQG